MHEIRFANEIVAILKEKLTQNKDAQATVNVRLSAFSHVQPETLKNTFAQLCVAEGFKNTQIKVLALDLHLECRACKKRATVQQRTFLCPFCHSPDIAIRLDKEFFIESIEIG